MIWWYIVPVIIAVIYLVAGWYIVNALVKRGAIETPQGYIFILLLWLPVAVVSIIWRTLAWLLLWPKRFAESQINKHSS
ncbi:hypothetical protein CPT_Merlin101 [Citrobacter phage Merlin]|uniref:Uncharacterized protein n=1 Tax=Citrobacter phage Merlin TaxID=1675602 RepID=A0A0K1LMJ3_9CAUD|nr:hypothetical protein CPT_Merlin101 [Citrobacter phage Merlin]AKU43747.1 hypothetical protein CPT_Merlin101 [Citrobacter phage Merlin]